MAGSWIKMRTDLADDPAVIAIAAATGLDEDTVVGKLHRLWSWADRQTTDGNAASVTKSWIERYICAQGFVEAMVLQGWLQVDDTGISFPNFDRHNGQTGKRRALTAKRVCNARRNANVTQSALTLKSPREREKYTIFQKPSIEEVSNYCKERQNGIDAESFVAHYDATGWMIGKNKMKDWKAAVRTWEAKRKTKGPRLPTPAEDAAWTPA